MGAITFGIPKKLILTLREVFSLSVFVETGTFKGESTLWAAKYFDKVYTIENSEALYNETKKKFTDYPNIEFIKGNSREKLIDILLHLKQPAVFWLDAHWCGSVTFGSEDECPLLDELKLIVNQTLNHIIVIDDARYFLKPPPHTHEFHQWPGIADIIQTIAEKPDYYTFVSEDVIASIPGSEKEKLLDYFYDVHQNEFPGGGILKNLRFAVRNIMHKWLK
jgi:hypothetical protein